MSGAPDSGSGAADATRKLTVGIAVVVAPVLAAAWVVLYLFPTRTEALWAWTIGTRMTPITMGAGYLGGVWFFVRVASDPEPHRHRAGFLGVTVLTTGLGIATWLHWESFNHGHVSFWAWLLLYVAAPVVFALLFVSVQRRSAVGPGEPRLPRWLRAALVAVGAVQVTAAAAMFAAPSLVIDRWPWAMTPLTVRSIGPFIAFTGVLALWALVDDRYSALRIGVEATTIGLGAIAVGALTALGDFTGPAGARVAYVGALIVLLGLLVAFLWTDPGRDTELRRAR
jgi:hypothetical protein